MSEFERKKRYIKYGDKKCKPYLRFDFKRKCAYCKLHEAEMIQGSRFFQIDHFRPQGMFVDWPEIHKYNNLFYSCEICNGFTGKNNNWNDELLDPCRENIFGEENHISDNYDADYKLIPLTPNGRNYIDTLKLDQQDHRTIRKVREKYQSKLFERKRIYSTLLNNVEQLQSLGNSKFELNELKEHITKLEEELLGAYHAAQDKEYWCDPEKEMSFLSRISNYVDHIAIDKIYAEFDLDYQINNGQHRCVLRLEADFNFTDGRRQIRIPAEQVIDWKNHLQYYGIIIFIYDFTSNRVFYNDITAYLLTLELRPEQRQIVLSIYENDELCDQNIERFVQNIS